MILLPCPGCEKILQIDDSRAGMLGKCRRCGSTFRAPGERQARPAPPPPKPVVEPDRVQMPDLELVEEETPPTPKSPLPEMKELVAASGSGSFSNLELEFEEPPPAPAVVSKPPPPARPPEARIKPESRETPAPPPRRPAPATPPRQPVPDESESVILEEVVEAPPPPRKPARTAVTTDSGPRRRPRLPEVEEIPEVEEVEEVDDQPEREERSSRKKSGRKKKKRPQEAEGASAMGVVLALAGVALVWMLLTPFAFFFRPMAFVMLVIGGLANISARMSFRRVARDELGSAYILFMFIPFYQMFFFITRISRMLFPFILWMVGILFLAVGGVSLFFHRASDEFQLLDDTRVVFEQRNADLSTPQGVDAEATRLLSRPTKEAKAWLREPENRRNRAVRALVDQAFKNGAKEVLVAGSDPDDEDETQLVVVLPTEPEARKKIFAWHRESEPDARDVGQKYFLLPLD